MAAKKKKQTKTPAPKKEVKKAVVTTAKITAPKVETPLPSVSLKEKLHVKNIVTLIKKPQIYVPVALLLAILLVFLLKNLFVVAVVNGQLITRPSLDSSLETQYGKQALSSMVTEILVEQYASSHGITVTQSDIDTQTQKISQQLAAQGQTLSSALAQRGMTMSDFQKQVKLQDLLQKILANQVKVSDKEIQDYIAQNKASLPQGQSQEQIVAEVAQQLQQQKLTTQAQAFIAKLQTQAHITYFVTF